MTALASTTGLEITINLLLVVFVLVCLLMSMIILMQRPKNEGLGAAFGSGATDQLFGAQTTNVLQKGTVYLGSLFFVLTISLAVLMTKRDHSGQSFVGKVEQAPPAEAPKEAPKDEKGASIIPSSEQPLESQVATPPVKTPDAGTPAPAPEPAPAPAPGDKPPGEAAPATPPTPPAGEEKPSEPAKPEAEEKPPGNP